MPIRFYQQWYDLFNNFSANAVEINGRVYPTAEHAYQAAKCIDEAGKQEISQAKSPILAKELSNRKYRDMRDPDWDNKKLEVMEKVLRAKLEQHEEVRDALRKSGQDVIQEESKEDPFWGIGPDDKGRNQLGVLWMKIRSELFG